MKKEKKGKKGKKKAGGGPDGNMTDFSGSLLSTDPDDEPDLSKMTEAEKEKYWADKKKRQEAREKKRREKFGDKYDEMMAKHQMCVRNSFYSRLMRRNIAKLTTKKISLHVFTI